jgi:uncharacterized membrane protein
MIMLVSATVNRLARFFIAGTLAVLPLVITVGIILWVGQLLESVLGQGTLIGEGLRKIGLQFVSNHTFAYVMGFVVVLAAVFLLGVAVESGARNLLRVALNSVLQRIPIIGSIYGTSEKMVAFLDKSDANKLQGMQPVFCFFGESGGCAILALLVSPEKYPIGGRDYQIVIVPTAPVPFGGGLFFMPAEAIRPANMPVEGLMSIYVSMGVTAPQYFPPNSATGPSGS